MVVIWLMKISYAFWIIIICHIRHTVMTLGLLGKVADSIIEPFTVI